MTKNNTTMHRIDKIIRTFYNYFTDNDDTSEYETIDTETENDIEGATGLDARERKLYYLDLFL